MDCFYDGFHVKRRCAVSQENTIWREQSWQPAQEVSHNRVRLARTGLRWTSAVRCFGFFASRITIYRENEQSDKKQDYAPINEIFSKDNLIHFSILYALKFYEISYLLLSLLVMESYFICRHGAFFPLWKTYLENVF